MKKIVLMMVMLFTMSIYSFADDTTAAKIDNIEKYDLKINNKKLNDFLGLDDDQVDCVDMYMSELQKNMFFAYEMKSDKILVNAIDKHIKCMRYILNDEQYRKYLRLINLTLVNKGFDIGSLVKD